MSTWSLPCCFCPSTRARVSWGGTLQEDAGWSGFFGQVRMVDGSLLTCSCVAAYSRATQAHGSSCSAWSCLCYQQCRLNWMMVAQPYTPPGTGRRGVQADAALVCLLRSKCKWNMTCFIFSTCMMSACPFVFCTAEFSSSGRSLQRQGSKRARQADESEDAGGWSPGVQHV